MYETHLWTGWVSPFYLDGHGNLRRLFVGTTITAFVSLLLFQFGFVRTFSFFVRHRPIHTNGRWLQQPINVEEVCSVRVIFGFRRINGSGSLGARSSGTDAIGFGSGEAGPAGAGPAIISYCMKPRLWTGWVSPFWLEALWGLPFYLDGDGNL